jgi:hypothetical protein
MSEGTNAVLTVNGGAQKHMRPFRPAAPIDRCYRSTAAGRRTGNSHHVPHRSSARSHARTDRPPRMYR